MFADKPPDWALNGWMEACRGRSVEVKALCFPPPAPWILPPAAPSDDGPAKLLRPLLVVLLLTVLLSATLFKAARPVPSEEGRSMVIYTRPKANPSGYTYMIIVRDNGHYTFHHGKEELGKGDLHGFTLKQVADQLEELDLGARKEGPREVPWIEVGLSSKVRNVHLSGGWPLQSPRGQRAVRILQQIPDLPAQCFQL